jgi:argininosuccinate lyase
MSGRLSSTLLPEAHAIVLRPGTDAALAGELATAVDIDRAHVVMLAERQIIPHGTALAILAAIGKLAASDFADLRDRPAPRGWYLMYEGYLVELLGQDIGGRLHTGRSRNDLSATLTRLRLREPFLRLVWEALRLQAVLLRRGRDHAGTVMPGFTHAQPALPITYGHYLAGVASALADDIDSILAVTADLDRCPLGAGALAGTSIPIDPARSAHLLGFSAPCANSIEAVASRDVVLRILSGATVLGVLLSRVATDLQSWSADDLGFLRVPDSLTGSSSMMPQKRNVYVLEHVQGRASAPLGAFTAAVAAMQKTPYTNAISVHNEGVHPAWDAIDRLTGAIVLLRLVIAHATPDTGAMLTRAETGYTTATELANLLAPKMGFRAAHEYIGDLVRQAIVDGRSLGEVLRDEDIAPVDAVSVARRSEYGGGPGPDSVAATLAGLRTRWGTARTEYRRVRDQWGSVGERLASAISALREET